MTFFLEGLCYHISKELEGMKIYLDLTFILNFLLCMLIFTLHDLVFSEPVPVVRKILASLIGSLYSILLILYPSVFSNNLLKIILFVLICGAAFSIKPIEIFIKKSLSLFTISFLGAGVLYWLMMDTVGLVSFINPVFDVKKTSQLIFFLLGIVIFVPLTRVFILNVKNLFNSKNMLYQLEITLKGRKVRVKGFMDTGNSLYDPVSKLPVVIVNGSSLRELLGREWENWLSKGELWNVPTQSDVRIYFVPFNSMGGEEILVAIKADEVLLIGEDNEKNANCLVGLNTKNNRMHPGVDALIHPSIVS